MFLWGNKLETEKMSLFELGQEYEKHAELQQFFIEKCSKDLEKAKKSGDYTAEKELESKLRAFRKIKTELMQTAEHLKNYYNKGEKYGKQDYIY